MASTAVRNFRACFIVGPTASGKSAVAEWIAGRGGYEILSADSMQVYRGLDIGTAKPNAGERAAVRYHGLDLVAPDQSFSVAAWLRHARAAFEKCERRGNKMIVAGGTGLYVSVLLNGFNELPPVSAEAHDRWAGLLERGGMDALREEAQRRFPGLMGQLPDPNNPRRLIRALERMEQGQTPVSSWNGKTRPADGEAMAIGMEFAPPELSERIARRVDAMFDSGLVEETRTLLDEFPAWATASSAIGYSEARDVLDGRLDVAAAKERVVIRTRQLAKRQRTWFRHQFPVKWIPGPVDKDDVPRAAAEVLEHMEQHGLQLLAPFPEEV